MRIKMLFSRAGADKDYLGGKEYDLPEDRALKFIERGFAAAVADTPVELAVEQPAIETTTKYRRKK